MGCSGLHLPSSKVEPGTVGWEGQVGEKLAASTRKQFLMRGSGQLPDPILLDCDFPGGWGSGLTVT